MVTQYKSVFIVSPAYFATGGTEALVVLCRMLRDFGADAKMYYCDARPGDDPVPARFRQFDLPRVEAVDDTEDSMVVIPETKTDMVRRYRKAAVAIWWLSVDNYLNRPSFFGPRTLWQWGLNEFRKFRKFKDGRILHLCQSYYAMDFVRTRGAKRAAFLMDFLGAEHLSGEFQVDGREDVVLYNPKKGARFTQRLMKAAGNRIRFVALQGMTPKQVREHCRKSKVYIDFGNHPGKDRFPREAAIAGCLVITSKNGSAAYHDDVPIPDSYKFADTRKNIPLILARIEDCLSNYRERLADFARYRDDIYEDRPRFERQVTAAFFSAE